MKRYLILPLMLLATLPACTHQMPTVDQRLTQTMVLARIALDEATKYAKDCTENKPVGHPCKGYVLEKMAGPVAKLETVFNQVSKVIATRDAEFYSMSLAMLESATLDVNAQLMGVAHEQ